MRKKLFLNLTLFLFTVFDLVNFEKTPLSQHVINFEDARIFKDSKKIEIIQQLHQNVAILKPAKGNGVVLLDNKDYVNSVEQLFKDPTKFKIFEKDPTITQMKTLQNYLLHLCNMEEISRAEFDQIRPKDAKPARAHGLPKMHKEFTTVTKFRLIIDNIGCRHYLVGKYVAQLIYPLKSNEFTLKDLLEAINRTQDIPSRLLVNGYKYVSLDVESLFTNVPIKTTIDVILKQIYI